MANFTFFQGPGMIFMLKKSLLKPSRVTAVPAGVAEQMPGFMLFAEEQCKNATAVLHTAGSMNSKCLKNRIS